MRRLLFLFIAVAVLWSLFSLSYSPLPWQDEVIFASVTHSLISGNGLSLEIDHNEPILIYGPVYFFITGIVTKIFGFGLFTFRITNCIFSFLTVLVLDGILKTYKIRSDIRCITIILLITDFAFYSNSHSGRMEFVALFFVLLSYLFYLKDDIKNRQKSIWIALFLTISMLTTPRVVVVAIVPAIMQLKSLAVGKQWRYLTLYLSLPIILSIIWMLYAFGSFEAMLHYYLQPSQSSLVGNHFGGNFRIAYYHYPIVVTSILVVGCSILKKRAKELLIFVVPILLFHFLIFDFGLYIVYVLPFYMLLIAWGLFNMYNMYNNKGFRLCLKSLVLLSMIINISVTLGKAFKIIISLDQRNPKEVSEWIRNNVPSGSKVAGNYVYYYAAIDNNCQFKRLVREEYFNKEEVINDIKDIFQPDYLMIQNNDTITKRISQNHFGIKKETSFKLTGRNLPDVLKSIGLDTDFYDGWLFEISR